MGSKKEFRIMLADDDPDDRELFTEAASGDNAVVESVPNGVELMITLQHGSNLPDIVFIDLNMPEKSGKECLLAIRQDARLANLPIVIYSTSSSKKDIDDTFGLGANLYITKPNSYTELKKTVQSILMLDWSKYPPKANRENFVYTAN